MIGKIPLLHVLWTYEHNRWIKTPKNYFAAKLCHQRLFHKHRRLNGLALAFFDFNGQLCSKNVSRPWLSGWLHNGGGRAAAWKTAGSIWRSLHVSLHPLVPRIELIELVALALEGCCPLTGTFSVLFLLLLESNNYIYIYCFLLSGMIQGWCLLPSSRVLWLHRSFSWWLLLRAGTHAKATFRIS